MQFQEFVPLHYDGIHNAEHAKKLSAGDSHYWLTSPRGFDHLQYTTKYWWQQPGTDCTQTQLKLSRHGNYILYTANKIDTCRRNMLCNPAPLCSLQEFTGPWSYYINGMMSKVKTASTSSTDIGALNRCNIHWPFTQWLTILVFFLPITSELCSHKIYFLPIEADPNQQFSILWIEVACIPFSR